MFHAACGTARLKPVFHPFWEDLPYANIFVSITPDVLHQMFQGVIKSLVSWLVDSRAYGADAINARARCLPPNHNARLFLNGITELSNVSGVEHKDMCRILRGLIVDLPLAGGDAAQLVRLVRAVLDFTYIAQYSVHSDSTLDQLDNALARFHANKQVLIDLGVRKHFNLPKVHSMRHYRPR